MLMKEKRGDELVMDKCWMHPNSEPRLRILHLNTNGITSKNNYIEWESLLDMLDEYQTDIYCLNEINVDTQQSKV